MSLLSKELIQILGVINITPDSFSDGGKNQKKEDLRRTFKAFSSFPSLIYDLGAESTAPFNSPLSKESEKKRLSLFIDHFDLFSPFLNGHRISPRISLDSYQPDNVFWFFEELLKRGLKSESFIWNDVSGKYDNSVKAFLKDFPHSRYIYSHNLSPSRELTSFHNEYQSKEDIISHILTYFKENLSSLGDGDLERVWLDPCFGFSKTSSQNWELLKRWEEIVSHYSNRHWVIGLSKKSFLRHYLSSTLGIKENLFTKSEWLHLDILRFLILPTRSHVKSYIFRVHDPDIIRYVKEFKLPVN